MGIMHVAVISLGMFSVVHTTWIVYYPTWLATRYTLAPLLQIYNIRFISQLFLLSHCQYQQA